MPDKDIRKRYCEALRDEWIPLLEFDNYRCVLFNKFVYIKFIIVRYVPEKLLNFLLLF